MDKALALVCGSGFSPIQMSIAVKSIDRPIEVGDSPVQIPLLELDKSPHFVCAYISRIQFDRLIHLR
jgi:hypothetical protein